MECWKCHGPTGHGDGPSAATLTDNKDLPIHAYDFSCGSRFMCGVTNRDLYKIFMTGLDGTPMPSFADDIKPAEAWDLVHFLRTLQPLDTPEAAIWKAWLASHARELKPIGPEGGGGGALTGTNYSFERGVSDENALRLVYGDGGLGGSGRSVARGAMG